MLTQWDNTLHYFSKKLLSNKLQYTYEDLMQHGRLALCELYSRLGDRVVYNQYVKNKLWFSYANLYRKSNRRAKLDYMAKEATELSLDSLDEIVDYLEEDGMDSSFINDLQDAFIILSRDNDFKNLVNKFSIVSSALYKTNQKMNSDRKNIFLKKIHNSQMKEFSELLKEISWKIKKSV